MPDPEPTATAAPTGNNQPVWIGLALLLTLVVTLAGLIEPPPPNVAREPAATREAREYCESGAALAGLSAASAERDRFIQRCMPLALERCKDKAC